MQFIFIRYIYNVFVCLMIDWLIDWLINERTQVKFDVSITTYTTFS